MCVSSSATRIFFASISSSPCPSICDWRFATPIDRDEYVCDWNSNCKSQIANRKSQIPSFRQLQLKPKTTSLANLALHKHPPAVHRLDDLLHQRQPQPGSLGHPVVGLGSV